MYIYKKVHYLRQQCMRQRGSSSATTTTTAAANKRKECEDFQAASTLRTKICRRINVRNVSGNILIVYYGDIE